MVVAELELLGLQGQRPVRLRHLLPKDLLQVAAQAGDRVVSAGAEQQAQAEQEDRGLRLACKQSTHLGGELGWVCIQLHLATLRRAEHRCHRGEASKQPQVMHLLHRSGEIQQKGEIYA